MIDVPAVNHKSRRRVIIGWVASDHKLPSLIRLSATFGFSWALLQILNNFKINVIPSNWRGFLVYGIASLVVFLSIELIILNVTRPRPSLERAAASPEEVFAEGLISYARSLAAVGQYKDSAILDLRSWSSRLLHLMGAVQQRIELGQIALTAAAALQDRQTQASILIDDLGWSIYKVHDSDTALANITEAVRIIDEALAGDAPNASYLSLKVKALRHIANIKADTSSLADARSYFAKPREIADQLEGAERELNNAQIDHSEAEVLLRRIDREVGATGQVDPTGSLVKLLNEAITFAETAESTFNSLGDTEREAKALKVKVQLLVHDTRKEKYREAATRLSRLEREVARDLR